MNSEVDKRQKSIFTLKANQTGRIQEGGGSKGARALSLSILVVKIRIILVRNREKIVENIVKQTGKRI